MLEITIKGKQGEGKTIVAELIKFVLTTRPLYQSKALFEDKDIVISDSEDRKKPTKKTKVLIETKLI